ncbi:MAG: hypothetical protein ABIN20_08130 [candidate division WOR-3 bacterium]
MKRLIGIFFACVNILIADRRYYVWTYQYATMERGNGEIEHYSTFKIPELSSLENNVISELQLELEVGMNDHFDASIYQIFEQVPGFPLEYKGYKIRLRHRFGEKNKYFLDPLVYFEYKGVPDFHKHAFEGKLILAKDLGRFNFAINPIFEYKIEKGEKEFEPEYALGISYSIHELLRFGIEFKGKEGANYFGPCISHGKDHLWVTLGSAFKIGRIEKGNPEAEIRLLVGIHSLTPPKKEENLKEKIMKMMEEGMKIMEKMKEKEE